MSNTTVKITIENGKNRKTLTLKNATVVGLEKELPSTKIELLDDGKGGADKDPTSYTLKLESHDEMVIRDDVLRNQIIAGTTPLNPPKPSVQMTEDEL